MASDAKEENQHGAQHRADKHFNLTEIDHMRACKIAMPSGEVGKTPAVTC